MGNSAFGKSLAVHLLFSAFLNQMSDALLSKTSGNITLTTNIKHQKIQEILWKFKGNKVVDWDSSSGLTEYLQFKGRTSLFQTTGDLTILNLKSEDSGIYEAEVIIDGNIHTVKHDLTVIDPVSNLLITCRPDDGQTKTLHCQAEGAQLTYSWSGSGLNTEIHGQIGPNITKEDNTNSVYYCVVKNPVSEETKDFSAADCFPECRNEETEGRGQYRKVVSQLKDAQVHQNEDVEETQERGERKIETSPFPPPKVPPVVPLKPSKLSDTKISQVEMSESNGGETERDQVVGFLLAHKGESSTWKDVDNGAPLLERGERETETVPSAPPKVPPVVPLKPSKWAETKISEVEMSESNDGETERDQAVGSLVAHKGESSTGKDVDKGAPPLERGERETETVPSAPPKVPLVVPLKPPKWSETKTSQVEMSESNDGETERDQAVGSLLAHKGESSTWKDADKGAPPPERGERETETVPSAPPKVPPVVPLKPPKWAETKISEVEMSESNDGETERDQAVGFLLAHKGESSTGKDADKGAPPLVHPRPPKHSEVQCSDSAGDTDGREEREIDGDHGDGDQIPPKSKDVPPCGPSDSSSLDSDLKAGQGTNITSLETTDSTSMPPPSNDTDPPEPESKKSAV